MAYKIKSKRKGMSMNQVRASELAFNYDELDNQSYLEYGSNYNQLDSKSKRKIALKVAKGFHWKVH